MRTETIRILYYAISYFLAIVLVITAISMALDFTRVVTLLNSL